MKTHNEDAALAMVTIVATARISAEPEDNVEDVARP